MVHFETWLLNNTSQTVAVMCAFMEMESASKICFIKVLVFRTNKVYKKCTHTVFYSHFASNYPPFLKELFRACVARPVWLN
jgi:hypothetical protein